MQPLRAGVRSPLTIENARPNLGALLWRGLNVDLRFQARNNTPTPRTYWWEGSWISHPTPFAPVPAVPFVWENLGDRMHIAFQSGGRILAGIDLAPGSSQQHSGGQQPINYFQFFLGNSRWANDGDWRATSGRWDFTITIFERVGAWPAINWIRRDSAVFSGTLAPPPPLKVAPVLPPRRAPGP